MGGSWQGISRMNSVSRYYLESSRWSDKELILEGGEAHHCVRVLRSKMGDRVEVFDGEGRCVDGELLELAKDRVVIGVRGEVCCDENVGEVHLCQAIPKGGNMELIVQKAVELGVTSIQPLITENTVARAEQLGKKQEKWQRIALEACKQCGQNVLPKVLPALKFEEWVKHADQLKADMNIVAALHDQSVPLVEVFSSTSVAKSVKLLVGPEGDFSGSEYDSLIDLDYRLVSLGNIVMRAETATLYCLSVLKHELSRSDVS